MKENHGVQKIPQWKNGTASIDGSLGTLDQKEEKWWDVYLENSNHTLISGEHI